MTQLCRGDLAGMTPEQIVEAKADGRINDLLGIPPEETALIARARDGQITPADVKALYALRQYDLIADAQAAGRVTGDQS